MPSFPTFKLEEMLEIKEEEKKIKKKACKVSEWDFGLFSYEPYEVTKLFQRFTDNQRFIDR